MHIGEKLKCLRVKNRLTQEDLANRCELSKGFISQLERDQTSPSIATLIHILEVLGTNLKEFFSDDEQEVFVYGTSERFIKLNKELGHSIQWLVANSQKHLMEPILITLHPDGSSEPEKAHKGEEFGYVLTGSIYVHMGNKKYRVKKGECFYITPSNTHFISNTGSSHANVLWISTPPTF